MQAELYVLVHPERYPLNEPEVIAACDPDVLCEGLEAIGDFEAAYGKEIRRCLEKSDKSLVILDPFDVETLEEECEVETLQDVIEEAKSDKSLCVCESVPLSLFSDVREADPGTLKDVVSGVVPSSVGARALIGGYARHDCVARVAKCLQEQGWDVSVCGKTALPMTEEDFFSYAN